MSKQLHKSFRKVLKVEHSTTEYNGTIIPVTTVLWCIPNTNTSRTVKTNHIAITVYIGGAKFSGVEAWMPNKFVSINLKNPLGSKFFDNKFMVKKAITDAQGWAFRAYVLGDKSRCENLIGTVDWFNDDHGFITVNGDRFEVYSCNIKGAKTWYPNTACMYLIKGETITLNLVDMGNHLTCRVTSGGHFDEAKWNSLDQSKLAFKCDENGKALNGLFE